MLQNFFLRHLDYNQQTRRFFMTIIAAGFAIDGVYAVLFNLYLLRLGYGAEFIGQVNSAGLLVFALVSLPAGLSGTRWSSSLMLRFGLGGILIGSVLLPMVEFLPESIRGFWLMMTYSVVLSGFSLYFVNSSPLLMALVKRDQQDNAFAHLTAILALAAFGGSLFGGNLPVLLTRLFDFTLDDPQPYRYTLLLTAIAIAIALAITMTIVPPRKAPEAHDEQDNPSQKSGKNGVTTAILMAVGVMALVRFLQVAGLATTSIFFNVYLDTQLGISPGLIGTIVATSRIIAVPAVLLTPLLIKRSNTGTIATLGSLMTALCLLPIALIPDGWAAASGYVSAVMGTNIRYAAFIVYIMVLVPERHQPLMAGAGEAAAGLSFALVAFGGGFIAEQYGFRELFLLGSSLSGLGTLVLWLYLRRRKARLAIA